MHKNSILQAFVWIVLSLSIPSQLFSQNLLVGPDDLPLQFTYCGRDTFSVDIRKPSGTVTQVATFSNVKLKIQLPTGMEYFPGTVFAEDVNNSIAHGVTNETVTPDLACLTFDLADFLPNGTTGDVVRVFVPVRANCKIPQETIEYDLSYDFSHPTNGTGSGTHSYDSDQIGLASPNIIVVDALSDYDEVDVSEGDVWTRSFYLENSVIGEYCVDTIYFIDEYSNDIQILGYNAGTIIEATATRNVVMLTSTDFLALTGKERICKGDGFTLTEEVESIACITSDGQRVSNIQVGVSCTTDPDDLCQNTTRLATHSYPLGDPGVYFRHMHQYGGPQEWPELSWMPSCADEGNRWTVGYMIINPSMEYAATEVRTRLYAHNTFTAIDTNAIRVRLGSNGTYTDFNGPWEYINKHYLSTTVPVLEQCAPGIDHFRDVRFRYPEIPPGDTLFVVTDLIVCWADKDDCTKTYYTPGGIYADVYYKDACGNAEYYETYQDRRNRQTMDSPPSTNYSPTIPEGTKGCFTMGLNGHAYRYVDFHNNKCDQNGVFPYGDPVDPAYEMIIDYNNNYLSFENDPGDFVFTSSIGTTWTPSSLDFTSNPGQIVAIFSLPPPYGFGGPTTTPVDCRTYTVNLNGTELDFKLKGVCPVSCAGYINSEVNFAINHVVDQCANEEDWLRNKLRCNDPPMPVTTVCEFCNPCDGTSVTSFTIERGNYGTADTNGDRFEDSPGANVPADPLITPEIATNRYFPGDTACGTFGLRVNTSQFSSFAFQYLRFGLPSPDYAPIDVDFTIHDASTGDTYSFEDVPGIYDNNVSGDELVYNMSPYFLQNHGPDNIPANFVFEQGDSIVGDFKIKIFENVGLARLQKILNITGFNTTKLDATPSERYSCNIFFAPVVLVGWEHNFHSYNRNMEGCNETQYVYYRDFFVGPHSNGNLIARDQFPYEYRELNIFDEYRIKIPNTINFRYLRWYYRGDNGGGGGAVAGENWIVDPQYYYVDSTSYELVIDLPRIMAETNNQFPTRGRADETARLIFRPYFQATCETELNVLNYTGVQGAYTHQFAESCEAEVPDTIPFSYNNRWWRQTTSPIVNATNLSPSALLYTPEACWNVRLTSGSNGPESMFMYYDADPGAIVNIYKVTRISDGQTFAPNAEGFYELGNYKNNTEEFEICATVAACDPGSINVYVGWQCCSDDYPESIEAYKAMSCDPFILDLYYEPLEEFVQAEFLDAATTDTVELCETINYSVEVASVSQAAAYNLSAYVVIPGANSPYTLNDGEAEFTYPYPTGAAQTLDTTTTTYGMSSTFPPFNGDAYFFDLSSTIDSLPGIGQPPGTPEEERTFHFDFSLETNCNTTSGTEVWFYLLYTDACGNERFTPTKFSKTIVIEGAVIDTLLDWIITMDDIPLLACDDEVTYQVEIQNLSRFTSKGQDQLCLTINENIDFITASCTAASDDCLVDVANPTITTTTPGPGLQGFTEICWQIPAGVEETEKMIMDMTYSIDPDLQCGLTQFAFATKAEGQALECVKGSPPYELCKIPINTTNGRPIFNLDVEKPGLAIDACSLVGEVNSPTGETVTYTAQVCNDNVDLNVGDPIVLNIHHDSNGNGMVDATDDLLRTDNYTAGLPNGSCTTFSGTFDVDADQTCGIILQIDPDVCKCPSDEKFIGDYPLTGTINNDYTMCSGDVITFNETSLPGYTYTWIGTTTGIQNTDILNTDYTDSNSTTAPVTNEFIVEISRGTETSCLAYDTIEVTIYPEIFISETLQNISCNGLSNGSIAMSVNGGLAPYTYLWSTGATTNAITGLAVGTYDVVITDDFGCTKEDSFEITEPTTLAVGTGSSASFCGQMDGTASVFPTGGTTPYSYSWNEGSTTASLLNLNPGYYYVTVTDAEGCMAQAEVVVAAGGGPDINTSQTNSACGGANNGTATVIASPASGSYSYAWSNGASTTTITGLAPGTYNLTVTDDVTSCISIANFTIIEGGDMELIPNVVHPECGAMDGAATVTIDGGTPPYTYAWSEGSTTTGLTNIGAGAYCVTVSDALSCTAETCMTLIETCCDLEVSESTTDVTCYAGTDGTITLSVDAGTPPYSFTWSHTTGLNGPVASNLSAGNYIVTVADVNCSTVLYLNIQDAELLDIDITKTNSRQCDDNNCSGTVDITMSGGTAPYSYFWTTGASGSIPTANAQTNTLTGICQGNYQVTVTDANGCQASGIVTVGVDPAFTVAFGIFNADCGGTNGSVTASISDGVPPFAFAWSMDAANTTNTATDLAAGTYTLSVTDATGCLVVEDFNINNNISDAPYLTDQSILPTSCGSSIGSINITVEGGTPGYTFLWSNGETTEDILNLAAGDYRVTITDADACIAIYDFIVTEQGFDVDFTYGVPPCNTIEGFIIANGVGGNAPYTYLWGDGSTNASRTDIAAGVYTVTVTDADGCSTVANAELNTTDGPQIDDVVINDINCFNGNDGEIHLTITGGSPPYNALWNNFQTGPSAVNLPVGTYTVVITDLNGCKAFGEYTISEPEASLDFQLNVQPYIPCFGEPDGSILLYHVSGTAPYTYLWDDGVTTMDRPSVTAGTYTVTVTDDNGCTAESTAEISEEEEIVITPAPFVDTLCAGFARDLELNIEGGVDPYTYAWNTGEDTKDLFGIEEAGTYIITVTDGLGCTVEQSYVLIESTLDGEYTSTTVICDQDDGTITVSTIGGNPDYEYEWSHDPDLETNIATDLAVGDYTITITDGTGCSTVVEASAEPEPVDPPLTVEDYEVCEGENIEFSTSLIADAYQWTGPNGFLSTDQYPEVIVATVEDAGTYRLSITYNDCFYKDTLFNIVVHPKPEPAAVHNDGPVCEGEMVRISTSTSADQYCWVDPSGSTSAGSITTTTDPFLDVTEAGSWAVIVKNEFGCASDISEATDVIINPIPPAPTASSNGPICEEEDLQLSATTIAGASYQWTGPNGFTSTNQNPIVLAASALEAGTYQVIATVNDCESPAGEILVSINENPSVAPNNNGGICDADLFIFANPVGGTPPYVFNWSAPDGTTYTLQNPVVSSPDASDEGSYSVTITDVNGCTNVGTTVVSLVSNTPNQPIISCNSPVCEGEELVISTLEFAAQSVSYEWTGPNGTTTSGAYPDGPNITIANANSAAAGTYSVIVTVDGCASLDAADHVAVVNSVPTVAPSSNPAGALCGDGNTDITLSSNEAAGTPPYTYAWTGPNGFAANTADPILTNVNSADAGTYTIEVTDANGCVSEVAQITLDILDEPQTPTIFPIGVVCPGEALILNTQVYSGTNVNYNWAFGGTAITNNSSTLIIDPASSGDAGTYTVEIEIDGCVSDEASIVVNIVDEINIILSDQNLLCVDGTSDLDLSATVQNGTAPFTYVWTGPGSFYSTDSAPSISNVSASNSGTYTLKVTDANGCVSDEFSTEVIITNQPELPQFGALPVVCAGDAVEISVQDYQGVGTNVSYNWAHNGNILNNNNNTLSLNPVTTANAGTYEVTVNVDGCISEANTITLVVNPALVVNLTNQDLGCIADNEDLVLSANVSGGTTPYSYSWTGPSSFTSTNVSPTISNVDASNEGTYTLSVTDALGCMSDVVSVEVSINEVPPTPNIPLMDVVCAGEDISITIQDYNGLGTTVVYNWFFNAVPLGGLTTNTFLINNAQEVHEGMYTVEVVVDGCTSPASSVFVEINEEFIIDIADQDLDCVDGTTDLIIPITAISPGTPPYTFAWSGPNGFSSTSADPVITNVTAANAGTYTVTVTDANNCTTPFASAFIDIKDEPNTPVLNTLDVLCTGSVLELNIDAYEGTNVTYNWSFQGNPMSNNSPDLLIDPASPLDNGTYEVYVSVDGCDSETASVDVNIAEEIMATVDNQNFGCTEGQTDVNLTSSILGGTGPFEYYWTGPNGFTSTDQTPVIPNASQADAGSYILTVTDIFGCQSNPGTGVLSITDGIEEPVINSSGESCGGLTTITVQSYSGADVTYDWTLDGNPLAVNNNQLIFNPASAADAGDYIVTVTVDGCSSISEAYTLTIFEGPVAAPAVNGTFDCVSGSTEIDIFANLDYATGTSPYTFSWTGPNGFTSADENPTLVNASGDDSGTYTLVVTDANGCFSNPVSVEIDITDGALEPVITSSGAACGGAEVILEVPTYSGFTVTYNWTLNGNPIANNSNELIINPTTTADAGNYQVEVIIDGCPSQSDVYNLEIFDDPTVSPSATTGVVCPGETMDLVATSTDAISWSWTGPNGFESIAQNPIIDPVTNLDNGTYVVIVTSIAGCTAEASIDVNNIVEAPVTPTITVVDEVCITEMIDLSIQENYSGTITYTWTNGNGAVLSNAATVSIPANDPLAVSPYLVTVNIDGCDSELSVPAPVTVFDLPIAVPENNGPYCLGEDAELIVSNQTGADFFWYDDDPTAGGNLISTNQNPSISNLTDGSYDYYLVVEQNGCLSTAELTTVVINPEPTINPIANYGLNADCSPADLNLEADEAGTGPFTFAWIGPNGFTSTEENPVIPTVDASANGSYVLTITDANGCTANSSVEVANVENAVAEPIITSSGPACEGEEVVLTTDAYTGSSVQYIWTTPNGVDVDITGLNTNQITISPINAVDYEGNYTVQVIVDNCTLNSDALEVEVFDSPSIDLDATAGNICEGGDLELFANPVDAVSYYWTGPNGFTSSAQDPILSNVDVNNNGTYVLEVSTINGCTATSSIDVASIDLAPAIPSITVEEEVCIDAIIDLAIQEIYAGTTTYNWTNGNGLSIGTTATVSLAANDPLAVSPYLVEVTIDGCPSNLSEPAPVIVNDLPVAVPENEGPYCLGEDATLVASNQTAADFFWYDADPSLGGVLISTNQNPLLTDLASGSYDYYLVVEQNGCLSSAEMTTIVINEEPTLNPFSNYDLNDDCSPTDLTLMAGEGGTGPFTYAWTGPSGFTSTEQNPVLPTVDASANGSYVLIITDSNGCTTNSSVEVADVEEAQVEPVIASSGPSCEGGEVILTTDLYNGSAVQYIWTTPTGVIADITGLNTNQIVISPINSNDYEGMYSVQIIVDNCTLNSDEIEVEIFDDPDLSPAVAAGNVCEGDELALFANATAATSYAWTGPNGYTSSAQDPILADVSVANNGTYVLEVTSINGCTATSSIDITSIDLSPAVPTITAEDEVCIDDMIDLAIQENYTGTTSYNWTNGNGVSIGTTAAISLAANDPLAVSPYLVEITLDGCSSGLSVPAPVAVNDLPVAVPENEGPYCYGEDATLVASNQTAADFFWYDSDPATGGNLISTNQNPLLTDLASGSYDYYLVVEQNGCLSSAEMTTVVINEEPSLNPFASYDLNDDCSPSDLSLMAGQGGTGPFTYAWTGPGGFASTDQNPVLPTVDASANGSYLLTMTDGNGCTTNSSVEVANVEEAQPEPIIASSGPTCEGGEVVLTTDLYNGSSVQYIWTTPTGVIADITGLNTNQIVISPANSTDYEGMYSVQVIVDNCTISADPIAVEIFEEPSLTPDVAAGNVCEGGELELFANAMGGTSYAWTGPNGFTSSAQDPILADVSVANNGTYVLEVTTINGCIARGSIDISNIDESPAIPTVTVDNEVCVNEMIDLSIQETYGGSTINYTWTNGDGTTIGSGATVSIAATDVLAVPPYRVMVDIDGCGSELSVPVDVTVYELPVAVPTNDGPMCIGEDVTLIASAQTDADYYWYDADPTIGGLLISTNQNPVMTNLATGSYDYYLVVVQNGCESSAEMTSIEINPEPSLNPVADYTLNNDCSASDLQLISDASGTGPFTYNWSGPNGFTSADQDPVLPTVDASANGSYAVTITDINGCTISNTLEVANVEDAQAEPFVTSSGPACEGDEVVLTVNSYSGSSVQYIWTTPTGVMTDITGANTNQIVISPVNAADYEGTYSVQVIVDNCTLNSDLIDVEVFDSPVVDPQIAASSLCEGEDIELFANGINYESYAWSGPNGFTSNAQDPVIANASVSNNGTYTLIVTNVNGCTATESITIAEVAQTPATPTITSESSVCEDDNIVLSIQENYIGGMVTYNWTNGMGTNIGTGSNVIIAASDADAVSPYRVTVSIDGCESELAVPIPVEVNEIPLAVPANNGDVCDGEDIQLFGGQVPNGTYLWYDDDPSNGGNLIYSSQNPVLFSPDAGETDYYLVVEANGCYSDPAFTTVVINAPPTLSPASVYNLNPDCSLSDLGLETNASGDGPFTYLWEGPNGFVSTDEDPGINNVTELSNGSYLVTITDDNGCSAFGAVVVSNITDPVAEPVINSSGPACDNEEITLTAPSYAGSNVTYTWTTPDGTAIDISGLTTNEIIISPVDGDVHTGDYELTVNVDGCELTSNVYTVNVFENPQAPTPTAVDDGICEGEDIYLQSTLAEVYEWTGPNGFSSDLQNPSVFEAGQADAGTYYLTTYTEQGCESEPIAIEITVDQVPATPTINGDGVCKGEDFVLRTSETCDSYLWIGPGGSSTSTLSNPLLSTTSNTTSIPDGDEAYAAGMWSVICVNGNGCESDISAPIEISINEIPEPTPVSSDQVLCGVEPFQLFAGEGFPEGTTYTWYDAEPSLANASVVANIQNPAFDENMDSGTYTYWLVVDVNGCKSAPSPVSVDLSNAPVVIAANDGTECIIPTTDVNLSTSAFAGLPPYTYDWIGPNGFVSIDSSPILPNAENVISGIYIVTITDSNGCTAESETVVDVTLVPDEPIIEFEVACEGDELVISAPEYEGFDVVYEWIGPNGTTSIGSYTDGNTIIYPAANASLSGSYQVQVTVDGCTSELSTTMDVIVNPSPAIAVANDGTECIDPGTDINLSATVTGGSGNYTYLWSGPNGFQASTLNPVIPNSDDADSGIYILTVTDQFGCTSTNETVIDVTPSPIQPTIVSVENIYCEGDIIVMEVPEYDGGNVTYEWIGPDGSTSTGIYTNSNLVTLVNADLADAGFYQVQVTVDGCTSEMSNTFDIQVFDTPEIVVTNDGTECIIPGTDVNFNSQVTGGSGNFSYEWTGPNGFTSISEDPVLPNASGALSGTYILTITDVTGCEAVSESVVDISLAPSQPTIGMFTSEVCEGDELVLEVSEYDGGTVTYEWIGPAGATSTGVYTNGNTITIPEANLIDEGNYQVQVTVDGCTSVFSAFAEVNVLDTPSMPLIENNSEEFTPVCEDEDVTLTTGFIPGATYEWIGPNGFTSSSPDISIPNATEINAGDYYLIVSIEGCSSEPAITTVYVQDTPDTPTAITAESHCEGADAVLSVTNPDPETLYSWYREADNVFVGEGAELILPGVTAQSAGAYYVIGSIYECESEVSDMVNVVVDMITNDVAFAGYDEYICTIDSFQLNAHAITDGEGCWTAVNPLSEATIFNVNDPNTMVTDLLDGENIFVWSIKNGSCGVTATDTVSIIAVNNNQEAIDDHYELDFNEALDSDVIFNDFPNTDEYMVMLETLPENGKVTLSDDGTFTYTPDENFVGVDSFYYTLCKTYCPTECVQALVTFRVGQDADCFAPTLFTPNGDEYNEYFVIPCLSNYTNSSICIFNRWGDQVYLNENYQNDWNGTYQANGETLPAGTYYYVIEVGDEVGTKLSGYVFIKR